MLLSESSRSDLVLNVVCYNVFVDDFCKGGMIDAAFQTMESMDRNEYHLYTWTYTYLVDGLCRQEKLKDA